MLPHTGPLEHALPRGHQQSNDLGFRKARMLPQTSPLKTMLPIGSVHGSAVTLLDLVVFSLPPHSRTVKLLHSLSQNGYGIILAGM